MNPPGQTEKRIDPNDPPNGTKGYPAFISYDLLRIELINVSKIDLRSRFVFNVE